MKLLWGLGTMGLTAWLLLACSSDDSDAEDLSAALLTVQDVPEGFAEASEPLPDNSPCFSPEAATDAANATFQAGRAGPLGGGALGGAALTQVVLAFDDADEAAQFLNEAADRILVCTYNSLRSPVSILEFPEVGDQTKALVVTPAPDATFTPLSWVHVRRDNLVTVVTASGFSNEEYQALVRLADERLAQLAEA